MSCERMESRILGYVDGRLKASERAEMEKHLADCGPCRLRVQEFSAVSGLLDELPLIEPSPEFDTRVHALVAAQPAPKASWWAWLYISPRIAFAASFLLLMALWIGYRSENAAVPLPPNDDQAMLQDLPVLEDHDVLQNFEPLKTLPAPVADEASDLQEQEQM